METEGNSDGVVQQVLLEIRKMNMTEEEVRMVLGRKWPEAAGVAPRRQGESLVCPFYRYYHICYFSFVP